MLMHRSDRTEMAWKHLQTARQCGLSVQDELYREVERFLKTHIDF